MIKEDEDTIDSEEETPKKKKASMQPKCEDTTDSEEETPKKKKASMQPKCEDAAEED